MIWEWKEIKTLWYSVIQWCRMFMGFIFYETFCRWRMKFLSGTQSIKYAAKSGRPLINKANVPKVRQGYLFIVMTNTRFTTCSQSLYTYISFWIIKDFCQMDDIWPKQIRVQTVKQLLNFFFQNSIKYNLKTLWFVSNKEKNLEAKFPKA